MISRFLLGVLMGAGLVLTSCSPSGRDTTADGAVDSVTQAHTGFCLYKEVSVRETPGDRGKYLATLYLSEEMTPTGDTASGISGNQKVNYTKVRLSNGVEGWVKSELVAVDAQAGAVTDEVPVYERPDISTAVGKSFHELDVVATRPASDGWVTIVGIPEGESWFVSGFARPDNVSSEPVDVKFAAITKRAALSAPGDSAQMYRMLAEGVEYKSSLFYERIFPPVRVPENGYADGFAPGETMRDDAFSFTSFDQTVSAPNGIAFDNHQVTFGTDRTGAQMKAGVFDGRSSYLSAPIPEIADNISIEFWVKSNGVAKEQTLIGFGNNCDSGFSLLIDAQGTLQVLCGGVANNVTESTYQLPTGQWVKVMVTVEGKQFILYANGKIISFGQSEHNVPTTAFTVGAGSGCNGTSIGGFFSGQIDDLFVYDRIINAAEASVRPR